MEKPAKWEELGLSGTSWLVSEGTNKEVRKRSETRRRCSEEEAFCFAQFSSHVSRFFFF